MPVKVSLFEGLSLRKMFVDFRGWGADGFEGLF
jgi:hypothetical protein